MEAKPDSISIQLKSLQKDLFDLSARNPLVKTDLARLWFPEDEANYDQAEKIYVRSKFFEKEYALKTVLLVESFFQWKNQASNEFYISPLLYRPATLSKKLREDLSFSISPDEENFTINPVLRKLISDQFNLDLPAQTDSAESLYDLIAAEFNQTKRAETFSTESGWNIICKKAVGIFNYKKLLLVNDYEKIIADQHQTINSLFGEGETKKTHPPRRTESAFAHELDDSQKIAVSQALTKNVVIQGPPGTGKSHTVANLIKSLLLQNKKVLFVSEKRTALDVVFQKLKKDKLSLNVAYFNSEKNEKNQFYSHLRKSWEMAFEQAPHHELNHPDKPKFNDLSDFYPNRISAIDTVSGLSIFELEEKLLGCDIEIANTDFTELKSLVPAYKVWEENLEFLQNFETQFGKLFKSQNKIQNVACIHLSASVFKETNPLQKIQEKLVQIEKHISAVKNVCSKYQLGDSLQGIIHYALAASVLNMVNKNQMDLLQPDHKKYKTFSTLAKKFQLAQIKLHQAEQVNQKWTKKPTISELTELTDLLKQKKKSKSILSILKRNSARSQDYFSDFSPEISTVTKLQLLEEVRLEWHLRNDLDEIRIKLKHELHIQNPETDIDHILQVRSKLQSISSNEYLKILEHPDSLQLIRDLEKLHTVLNQLTSLMSYLGIPRETQSLPDIGKFCQQLAYEIPALHTMETELRFWFKLPSVLIDFVRRNHGTISELNTQLIHFHLKEITRFEPRYKLLSGNTLLNDYNNQKKNYSYYHKKLNSFISYAPTEYLKRMERLAQTSTARLKTEQKTIRKNYKDAKRIITHELNKKQRHLPVNDLLNQCYDVVFSLQPVWMMNPLSVSQYLPCLPDLFDVVIFDEASQIPLEDAIPSVYRGARLVVAGDSKQMPPGNFFSSNPDGKTLLDQAAFNLKNQMLTRHYRSEHPALISFSNSHFYDNELLTLPPVNLDLPIEFVQCNGLFYENKNNAEAKSIAQYYKSLLKADKTDIGIIAFSREQQLEIEKEIRALNLPQNELLFVRNLENVQGNEKEIILISVGYGKNKEGVFRKNFGPINQEHGVNRLNVLFTRAIQKMVVFSSVTSADFGFSDNDGVNMLAAFLKYAENFKSKIHQTQPKKPAEKIVFNHLQKNNLDFNYYAAEADSSISAFINHSSGKIFLVNPAVENNSDLYAMIGALKDRFNEIKIVVNADLISDRKRTEKEIQAFFK